MTCPGFVAASLRRGELFATRSTAAQRRGYNSFSFGAVSGDQGLDL